MKTRLPFRVGPLAAVLGAAAALLVTAAQAQQRTNRDQSGYTELRPEGYPVKAGLRIVPAQQAKLAEAELVIGLTIGGEARAYPVNLMWGPESEALNDELAGVPLVATWCPVAHSAVVFERTVGGQKLEIGTLGLEHGVFQLYDRQTRSAWSQVSGVASRGPQRGRSLPKRASLLTSWGAWRRLHPHTTVFFDPDLPNSHPFVEDTIARITLAGGNAVLRNEDLVAGVETRQGARAWLLRRLGAARALNDTAGGVPVAVFLAADAVSVRVWQRRVGGRVLELEADGDRLSDRQTGAAWDGVSGAALPGSPVRPLEPLVVTTALWYAWKSQHPGTTAWTGEAPASP